MGRIIVAIALLIAGICTSYAEDEARASIGDTRLSAGDEVVLDEPVEGNAFVAAGRAEIRARVERSAFITGGDVTIIGPVGRRLYAAGGDVRIEGEVEGRVRAAGGKIRVASTARLNDSATFAGGTIEVDGEIADRLRAFGETIVINGRIGGDVEVAGESIRIGPDARIGGRIEYRSGSDVQVDPAAQVGGGVMEVDRERRWLRRVGHGAAVVGGITVSLGMVLVGALMILLAPRFSREAAGAIQSMPLQSFGLGCVMLLGIPFAIVVLLVTIIGIPLALLLGLGYAVMLLLGYLVGAIFVGDFVTGKVGKDKLESSWWRVLFLLLALIAIAIVKQIPLLGGLAVFLLFLAGVGAFTMRTWQGFRRNPEAPAAA
ncbi:MAG: bactofilin family protein [Gammaproteobacteria bacterium]